MLNFRWLCGVVVSLGCVSIAEAVDRLVPSQYPDIQAAINASSSGDVVVVSPGTYNQRLDIGGRNITLRSTLGAAATIIDPQGAGGVVINSTNPAANGWTLDGFTIRNGLDSGLNLQGVQCTIKDCVFLNNRTGSPQGGGGVRTDGGIVAVLDCTFRQCESVSGSAKGGAILSKSTSLTLERSTFDTNRCVSDTGFAVGGSVAVEGGVTTVAFCTFLNSSSVSTGGGGLVTGRGGALDYSISGSHTVIDCSFTGCLASGNNLDTGPGQSSTGQGIGGAICQSGSANLEVNRTSFTQNKVFSKCRNEDGGFQASYSIGAAIYCSGPTLTVTDCQFADQQVEVRTEVGSDGRYAWGGSIFAAPGGQLSLARCTFARANLFGDSIDARAASVYSERDANIVDCNFVAESTPGIGGAITFPNSTQSTISSCTFSECASTANGGAIWLTGGNRTFTDCTFTNNIAQGSGDRRGGAVYAEGGAALSFTDCDFTGNAVKATGNNGDQWAYGGACGMFGVTPKFTRCSFNDNLSQANGTGSGWRRAYGGANADYDSDTVYTDCVFDGNKAEWTGDGSRFARGGSVWMWSSDGDFVRTTINDSSAGPATAEALGGGVCLENVSRPGFTYSTFDGCSAQKGGALASYSSEPYLVSTSIRDCTASVAGGGMLVDAGSTPYVLAGLFERNASPLGGAIRSEGSGTNLPFVVNTQFCGNTVTTLSGSILGGEGNQISEVCNTDCNGNGVNDAEEIAGGAADIDLNGVLDSCQTDCNANGQPDAYELGQNTVPDCNGNGRPDSCDIASGVSLDAAGNGTPDECELVSARLVPFEYPTITAAINAAANGDTIVVAPGAYYEKFNFGSKSLVFKSVGGAAVTYLDGNGQNGTIVTVNGGQGNSTIIDGFTFWYAQGGHALYIQNASPTVRNCRFLFNNVADGAALRIDSPSTALINDCTVESNTATNGAGLWTNATPVLTRVLFKNNVVSGVGGAARLVGGSPAFLDCEFTGNRTEGGSSVQNGGAIHATNTVNMRIQGCDFTSNLALSQGDNADRVAMGGAIFAQDCTRSGANPPKSLVDCAFTANIARTTGNGGGGRRSDGGAVVDWNSDLIAEDCTFTQNRCESTSNAGRVTRGAAWFGLASNAAIRRCTFSDGAAATSGGGDAFGGAVYLEQASNGVIESSVFDGGTAQRGGALYLAGNSQPNIQFNDFLDNSSTASGGAIHANASPALIFDCDLRRNASPSGSAIFAEGATGPSVFGCTLCGNPGADVVGPWTDSQNSISELCADCNANGIEDAADIAAGAPDCDGDGRPDDCQPDADGDGAIDACDGCPTDPLKIDPGSCGCGIADGDLDGDGVANCDDGCPNDPSKTQPGACGCGVPDTDTDGDGAADCVDGCPDDAAKTAPGACGCGVSDVDSDGDGVANCVDGCPTDPAKTSPGSCGCGVPDTDSDGDGVADCNDGCPNDPLKSEAGSCGCGAPETDTDGDAVPDCVDNCAQTANSDQADCDGDGVGDACTPPVDCDQNGINDRCDIASGAADVDGDGALDACEPDCNANALPDDYELTSGLADDCNLNGQIDACEISSGSGSDIDGDGVLDECEVDCNNNGIIDVVEIAGGAPDCDGDEILDACQDGSTLRSSLTAPWGGGAPAELHVSGVPVPVGVVKVRLEVVGDLDAVNEFATLKVNGSSIAVLFGTTGQACPAAPQVHELTYTASQWNQLISGGSVVIRLEAPSTVSATECGSSRVAILVSFQNGASDCDADGTSDRCELFGGSQPDCDGDQEPDSCAIAVGAVPDCNGNDVPDSCDLVDGTLSDCDADGVPDSCAIGSGQVVDCNANGVPDSCDLSGGAPDCNDNSVIDACDISLGTSADVDSNGIPDECKADCNDNDLPDAWEVSTGLVPDCNGNGHPDSCDIANGATDCNGNGVPDTCDVATGLSNDVNADGRPDECEADCNSNGVPDRYEVAQGLVADCNSNGLPDSCDLAGGAPDCNGNGIIDSCDVASGETDDNANQVPDACEFASGDFDLDGQVSGADLGILLSLWGLPNPPIGDFNGDGVIGGADLGYLIGRWSAEP